MFAEGKTSFQEILRGSMQDKGNEFRAEILKFFVAWTKEYRCKLYYQEQIYSNAVTV